MPIESDAQNKVENAASAAPGTGSPEGAPVSALEKNLMQVAEELGTLLGKAERKTTDFLAQQTTITDHLVKIRDTASRLIAQVEKARERSR